MFSRLFPQSDIRLNIWLICYLAYILCSVPPFPNVVDQQAEGKELTKEEKQRLRKEKKQQKKNKEKKDDKASQESGKEKKPVSSAAPASQPPTPVTAQKGAHDTDGTNGCIDYICDFFY